MQNNLRKENAFRAILYKEMLMKGMLVKTCGKSYYVYLMKIELRLVKRSRRKRDVWETGNETCQRVYRYLSYSMDICLDSSKDVDSVNSSCTCCIRATTVLSAVDMFFYYIRYSIYFLYMRDILSLL